jgi:hypothetical protein
MSNYKSVKIIIRPIGGGLSPSCQTVGSSLRTPWQVKPGAQPELSWAELQWIDELPIQRNIDLQVMLFKLSQVLNFKLPERCFHPNLVRSYPQILFAVSHKIRNYFEIFHSVNELLH